MMGVSRVVAVLCPGWPDARPFEPVARALEAVTPLLEVVRPGLVAFPARGALRHAGGVEPLVRAVHQSVKSVGVTEVRVGVADGLFAATLAARDKIVVPSGESAAFLAPLSVGALGRPELADLLVRLGLPTLGEFAALPPGAVAERLGADGMAAHRLARGLDERPLAAGPPPPELTVTAEIDPPAEQATAAAFAVRRLAEQLHARLGAAGLTCTQLVIAAETEHGEWLSRRWRHEGTLSAAGVAERARWQLDGWLSGAAGAQRPTAGLTLLRLAPDGLTAAGSGQLGLWGEPGETDGRVARALARVQGMLGPADVLTPVLGGGRDPAERVTWVPWGERREPRLPPDAPWPGRLPVPSPATVPAEPLPVELTDADGRPVAVSGRASISAVPVRIDVPGGEPGWVAGWSGPWPVDARWWDPAQRDRRARLQVMTTDGRAYLLACAQGRWRLEGSYN
jgi:protein ImuB